LYSDMIAARPLVNKMKSHILRPLVIACLALLLMPNSAYCQVTVILSRHAEKAATPPKDPPLTEAGKKRADLLASMLADSGVDAIYVTEYQRTQQTAAPLADRVHVKPTVVADTQQLIAAIRARKNGVVVVVGHSNTLPEIIAGLGGPKLTIADPEYNNLFVLTVGEANSSLLRLHYGDSTPVPSPNGSMQNMMGEPVK
jgi:broad specificity phosphatase PhoE